MYRVFWIRQLHVQAPILPDFFALRLDQLSERTSSGLRLFSISESDPLDCPRRAGGVFSRPPLVAALRANAADEVHDHWRFLMRGYVWRNCGRIFRMNGVIDRSRLRGAGQVNSAL